MVQGVDKTGGLQEIMKQQLINKAEKQKVEPQENKEERKDIQPDVKTERLEINRNNKNDNKFTKIA